MALNVSGSDSLYWKTGLDNRGLRKDASSAKGIISGVLRQISALDVAIVAATWTALKTKRFIKDATILAARYETLGVVLRNIGINAGYSSEQMNKFARGLEEQGISMLKARQTLIQMVQAHMDLNKANQLARIAQDAAVIGNINSSEAFNRMITGIQQGRLIILRTIGLNVQFERAYTEAAKAIGKSAEELTELEKVQIRTNVVMEAGTRISGSYEAAMSTAGKQMLSLERHLENLKVLFGALFTPILAETIGLITEGVTGLNDGLLKNEDVIVDWGNTFRLTLLKIEAEVMRVAMTLDLLGNSMFRVSGILAEMGKLIETGARKMWPLVLIPEGVGSMFGGVSKKAAEAMLETEKRFTETFVKYQKLVSDYILLEDSMTDAAKEEAEKRRKIAEDKLLELQKLAKEAEAGLPDVSVWGLLTSEEMDDFAVEMALITEKEIATNKKLAEGKLKNNRELLNEILKDTRKFNKEQLHDYIKFLSKKAELITDNTELQKSLYEEVAKKTEELYQKEIVQLNEIAEAFDDLTQFVDMFDEKLSKTISGMSDLIKGFVDFKSATTIWGETGATVKIFSSLVGILKELTDETENLNTNWDWFVKNVATFGIEKKEIKDAIKVLDELYGSDRADQISTIIDLIEEEIKRLKELAKTAGRAVPDTEALQEALQNYLEEYRRTLTGTTRKSIADAITNGLMDGLDTAQIFANTFEDLIYQALVDAFKRSIIAKEIERWYTEFAELAEGGLTAEEIENLRNSFMQIIGIVQEEWEAIEDILEGLNFDISGTKPTGMTGAIAGITEKTAGILAGQFNAMRMTSVQVLGQLVNINEGKLMPSLNALREIRNSTYNLQGILNRMNDVVWNTERIAKNTDYNIHLESIDSKLTNISNFARVMGG